MGRRYLKQPDGKYAVWSTVVDDFIFRDMDADMVREWYVKQEAEKAREHINDRIETWENGESPYPGDAHPRTFEEAVEWKETISEGD